MITADKPSTPDFCLHVNTLAICKMSAFYIEDSDKRKLPSLPDHSPKLPSAGWHRGGAG